MVRGRRSVVFFQLIILQIGFYVRLQIEVCCPCLSYLCVSLLFQVLLFGTSSKSNRIAIIRKRKIPEGRTPYLFWNQTCVGSQLSE